MTEVTIKILNEFVKELEKAKIKYMIIAGIGLDGKRGYLTRAHQDLDVLCLKRDLPKIESIIKILGYSGQRYHDLYKIFDNRMGKVDIGLVALEDNEAVIDGRIAITRFPKELFEHPQRGHIGNVDFNIAPNELLKTWGNDSQKGNDSDYAKSLPADEEIIKKIKRALK